MINGSKIICITEGISTKPEKGSNSITPIAKGVLSI